MLIVEVKADAPPFALSYPCGLPVGRTHRSIEAIRTGESRANVGWLHSVPYYAGYFAPSEASLVSPKELSPAFAPRKALPSPARGSSQPRARCYLRQARSMTRCLS